jgi:peptide/nickel transport system permease protein
VAAVATVGPAEAQAEEQPPSLLGRLVHSWVLRRIIKSVITVYLVASCTFFLTRYMPGKPIDAFIAQKMQQGITRDQAVQEATSLLSYNPKEPLIQQYFSYIWGLLHGDMGQSIVSPGTPVTKYVSQYLPWTLFSVGVGVLISFVVGIFLGILIAYRRGGFLDHFITNIASLLHAIPNYVWAIAVIIIGGVKLKLFDINDIAGAYSPGLHPNFSWDFISDAMYHAALPIAVYAATSVGAWIIVMKSSTTQVLDEDFVTVAKARGLRDGRIRTTYVGRNAVLPLFTAFAISIGFVVGGSTLVEQIFRYQGVGYYLWSALQQRDYPVLQGFVLVITISVVVANLVADLLLSRVDPRIRTEGAHQ